MENQAQEDVHVKVEETAAQSADEPQPQDITDVVIVHGIPAQSDVPTSPLPVSTVITSQRHRMITTAGHIR